MGSDHMEANARRFVEDSNTNMVWPLVSTVSPLVMRARVATVSNLARFRLLCTITCFDTDVPAMAAWC